MSQVDPARIHRLQSDITQTRERMQTLFQRVSTGGRLDALLPHPTRGVILVPGPRFAGVPAEVRNGLLAAHIRLRRLMTELDTEYNRMGW